MGLGECFGEGAEISTRGRVRSPEKHSPFALRANLVIVLRRGRCLITSPPQDDSPWRTWGNAPEFCCAAGAVSLLAWGTAPGFVVPKKHQR